MRNLLLVLRPLNLSIVVLIQWAAYYFLHVDSSAKAWWPVQLTWLIASTVCITAAGYILNDWLDLKADRINKANKVYLDQMTTVMRAVLYAVPLLLGMWFAWRISTQLATIMLAVSIVLALYSLVLKRIPLVGNMVISALAFLSVYLVHWTFIEHDLGLILFFSSFAALITLVREQVKTIEDVEGDEAAGYRSLPIAIGVRRASYVARYTFVAVLVIYINLLWQWLVPQFAVPMRYVFGTYQALCVILPMLVVLRWLYRNPTAQLYGDISKLVKYIMVTGSLSMLFF